MKVDILTVVKMKLLLFWVVTSRVLIGRYNIAVRFYWRILLSIFAHLLLQPSKQTKTSNLISDTNVVYPVLHRQRERIHPLASVSRPALGPTQPPVLSPGVKRGRGVTLTTHPNVVPRTRMSMIYIFSFPWRLHSVVGQLYFIVAPYTVPNNRSVNKYSQLMFSFRMTERVYSKLCNMLETHLLS
jgi:hypothetical protein